MKRLSGAYLNFRSVKGYSCSNRLPTQSSAAEENLECYGYTGKQVLDSMCVLLTNS